MSSPACPDGIFEDASRPGTVAAPGPPAVRRLRRVEIDPARLFPSGAPVSAAGSAGVLVLNLFPDVCVTATREAATDMAPGRVQWVGRIGPGEARATLVMDGAVLVGRVTIEGALFRISYLGDGVHAVAQLDPGGFPRD